MISTRQCEDGNDDDDDVEEGKEIRKKEEILNFFFPRRRFHFIRLDRINLFTYAVFYDIQNFRLLLLVFARRS